MFHEPVLDHKLYNKNAFYLFQHVFVLDHARIIVLFPNKILNWIELITHCMEYIACIPQVNIFIIDMGVTSKWVSGLLINMIAFVWVY